MRITHIVAGLSPSGGGLSEFVSTLARETSKLGHEVSVVTVARRGESLSAAAERAAEAGVRLVLFEACFPHFLYFSAALLRGLKRLLEASDIVHVHSNWTFPVWRACRLAWVLKKPLVMMPHGCLDAVRLRHSGWKKGVAGRLFDRRYLRRANVILATCQAEADAVAAYVGPLGRARLAVVPSGVDLEAFCGVADGQFWGRRFPVLQGRDVALYLGRLHPLKGLDLLVAAWERVCHGQPAKGGRTRSASGRDTCVPASPSQNWRLVIAGPDEQGTRQGIQAQICRLGLEDRVLLCGPLAGEDRRQAMQNADLFVLPTRSENFGIVVAEALACCVPVITTRGAPWQELLGSPAAGRCGWWVDVGVEPIAEALREAMGLSKESRQAMGENGRRLVEAKYRWESVAQKMEKVYEKCVNARLRECQNA